MAVVGAADVNIAGPAAAVAKITISAAGVAGVPVTAGAAVFTAVTAAEGTSVDMSQKANQYLGCGFCRPEVESRHGTLERGA